METAFKAGVLIGVRKESFEEKLSEFEAVQFQAWAESVARISREDADGNLLTDLSLIPANTARVSLECLELANRMLEGTERSVEAEIKEGEHEGTGELQRVQDEIGTKLQTLGEELAALIAMEDE
jgi:hypothetical protein